MVTKSKRKARASAIPVKLAELSFAAPQVIAHRIMRIALAGPTPSARDRKEFSEMVLEKQAAGAQAWIGMFAEGLRLQQQFARSLLTAATPRQHAARAGSASSRIFCAGLTPVHRRAVANVKRLARTKLR